MKNTITQTLRSRWRSPMWWPTTRRRYASVATPYVLCALLTCVASVGCGRGRILDGDPQGPAKPCGGQECTNPVDASLDRFIGERLEPLSLANDKELCRRLFVDALGRLPTPEDFASHCQGRSLADMVEHLLALPEYILARQKLWADKLGYNDTRTWYRNLIEMDNLVGQHYRGEITFDAFIDRAVIHPSVLTAADETEAIVVERAVNPTVDARTLRRTSADAYFIHTFEALVLRSPTAEEYVELPNLFRIFEVDPVAADPALPGFNARRLRVQPCNCVGARRATCVTTNPPVDLGLTLRFPQVADCAAEPGNSYYIEDVRAEELSTLITIGAVLRGRPDFYANHVKDTLQRLLGYNVADYLPADVYASLIDTVAAGFKADNSLRNLEANIFLSALYRQSQTPEAAANDRDGKPSPIFAGPRKRLPSDAYFSSIATMTGHDFGVCDHRLQTRRYSKNVDGVFINAFAPPPPVSQYPVKNEITSEPDTSGRDRARLINACTDHVNQWPSTDSGPFFQIGLDVLARDACVADAAAVAMLPAGYRNGTTAAEIEQVVDHQFNRLFLEAPSATSRAAAVAGVQACLDGAQCTADTAARSLCVALLKSAQFATY